LKAHRYAFLTMVVTILTLSTILLTNSLKAQEKPLVVVYAKGLMEEDIYLKWMMGNVTEVQWKVYTEKLTYDDIKDAKMLILVLVDPTMTFTDSEIAAIKKWLDDGGKTLWVTGDSDYKMDSKRVEAANKVLEAIGSRLRNEHCEATDVKSNCGKDYRVAAIIDPDEALDFLKVSKPVLFHGPGPIIAYENGKYIPLEKKVPKGIYRIAWTSDGGRIAEFTAPRPEVHEIGAQGKFVLMAVEVFPKDNLIIVSGESPIDHYRGMWIDVYHEVELDGPAFVKNIILWGVGLKGKRVPKAIPWIPIAVGVIVVIVVVVVLLIKFGKMPIPVKAKSVS